MKPKHVYALSRRGPRPSWFKRSVWPALRAAKQDPIEALRYE